MPTPGDYKTAAQTAYEKLKHAYKTQPVFWRCGHALDTILDYYTFVDNSDASNFGPDAFAAYTPASSDWYDDFGWWAVATLKAVHSSIPFTPSVRQQFQSTLNAAWNGGANGSGMKPAPQAWQNSDQKDFGQYAPYFDGGVWNCPLQGSNAPGGNSNGGRQNTVTNGLYLVFTTRAALYGDPTVSDAKILSGNEYGFFRSWFTGQPIKKWTIPPDRLLLNALTTDKFVVRERVGAFLDASASDPYFESELAWAGDEGIVLGGLIARLQLIGSSDPEYNFVKTTAINLLNGSRSYLSGVEGMPADVLAPWSVGGPPGDDPTDYWTGIGVYMRYLLDAFASKELKATVQGADFQRFLTANAQYVLNGSPNHADTELVRYANDLACLVAAIVCLNPS